MTGHILAIDQGTTSSRALVLDASYAVKGMAQQEFRQIYPESGWVEHDPEDIWDSVVATCRNAIADAGLSASEIAAIGITNQRETTLVWDRDTGKPVMNAIVWQDRRTADVTNDLRKSGYEAAVTAKSGLLLEDLFKFNRVIEVILHQILAAPGDQHELINSGRFRFLDGVLNQGFVDNRQHFLGHALGRR